MAGEGDDDSLGGAIQSHLDEIESRQRAFAYRPVNPNSLTPTRPRRAQGRRVRLRTEAAAAAAPQQQAAAAAAPQQQAVTGAATPQQHVAGVA